ncbi:CvpA family protein [Patescibacteria group bacterium]|nr:CvpA family protein [Patescibacteria group bacterium]
MSSDFPALHGNWVDLVILIFLALYAVNGFRRGFFALLIDMGSFIGAFLLALKFYPFAAQLFIANFSFSLSLANATGFLITAIISELILAHLLLKLYLRVPPKILESFENHMSGIIPAIIDGLIILAFIIAVLISLPVSPGLKRNIIDSRIGGKVYEETVALEQTMGRIFGGAVEETLNFLTVRPTGSDTVDLHFSTTNTSIDTAGELEMLNFVNSQRQSAHLAPLTLDSKLTEIARNHSKDMFARGYFSHISPDGASPFDRMHAAGIFFLAAGENIAYAPTTNLADIGLINSPEHRANILSPDFHKIGVGVIDAGVYGKMFTQDFTN